MTESFKSGQKQAITAKRRLENFACLESLPNGKSKVRNDFVCSG
jgi:hypothetical protein